jgi:hypothetical protein
MATARKTAAKPARKPAAKPARKTAAKPARKTAAKTARKTAAKPAPARKTAAAKPGALPAPESALAEPTGPTNHIALVLDRSGSMSSVRKKLIQVCNDQLRTIQANADVSAQPTYVSLYTFQSVVDRPLFFVRRAQDLKDIPDKAIRVTGATALLDGVGTAVAHLSQLPGALSEHTSHLVVTVTDGYENSSRKYKKDFGKMLAAAQATGRWSFAFLCPRGGVSTLRRYGVPEGNIAPWEANQRGAEKMGKQVAQGLSEYYKARAGGQRAVTKFFVTDLASVDEAALKGALVDLSGRFARWPVAKSAVIREFVNARLKDDKDAAARLGKSYATGRAYYELNKPETVQAGKELVIMDKDKGALYGGAQARALLGLPAGESCKVKPGDHGHYAIFVASTSVNRRLTPGTTLLYREP